MSIKVALNHKTHYRYDRPVQLGPQVIRLRPAPHSRTPILSYSLKVEPAEHFQNWQQDPLGNYAARCVFPKTTREFLVQVDLVADMTVINPFDFFVDQQAREFPFQYDTVTRRELDPYLSALPAGPVWQELIDGVDRRPRPIVEFLVDLNLEIQKRIGYLIRLEPGVQSPDETMEKATGSCRDSGWLLVQTLRHLGLAARFVSGYLIQLTPDIKALDGPSGPEEDFTDLHAWAEVYIPGAGWLGLDPTSGLFAGEGHIPLACTPEPAGAAPISGALDPCEAEFEHSMLLTRIEEQPRVTQPYTDDQWAQIETLGRQIDQQLNDQDVRLTMGGEPTFVSIDDMDGDEWKTAAVGPAKRQLSEDLILKLRETFAPGAMLHYGTGKWYPGESLPRWALTCLWRCDGVPVWRDSRWIARPDETGKASLEDAEGFIRRLCELLGVPANWLVSAYEDVAHYLLKEQRLPVNVDPRNPKLRDPEERARLSRIFSQGFHQPVGLVLPLRRAWWQSQAGRQARQEQSQRPHRGWVSGPWPVRAERFFLLPGDSPLGLRLPLDSLPWVPADQTRLYPEDAFEHQPPLPEPAYGQAYVEGEPATTLEPGIHHQQLGRPTDEDDDPQQSAPVVRTALCVEVREGRLHVFMPPVERLEDYLDLVSAIEQVASEQQLPVVLEGYLPPHDSRVQQIKVTPDPGVIEVNVHPAGDWEQLTDITTRLYQAARECRLGTEKFDLDGKHTGTGGGNHIVLGAATPADSPFLRRPDLLKSMVGYWLNHPSLSYLFSSRFVGPTSQAPRVDEGRRDALYELELAFRQIPDSPGECPPWLVDRVFRNLLIDLTGNTHRAEFCIDKLYSPDSSTGRLGLLELRGFEMPPHARMSLAQQLLIRGLIAMFWKQPFRQPLIDWGTALHDRFLLPHFVWQDFGDVIGDLQQHGFPFQQEWFRTHLEFRFPAIGHFQYQDMRIDVRSAIEPWYVLGEEPAGGGTVRFVDSSLERLQVKVSGLIEQRYQISCNGRPVPLRPTGVPGEMVAGVRYRAWCPPSCLHPTIPVHTPLVIDLVDLWSQRSVAGCTYHVAHPAGRNYETFPVNANEAEARRAARFFQMGHTPGSGVPEPEALNPAFPLTLDLRRPPQRTGSF